MNLHRFGRVVRGLFLLLLLSIYLTSLVSAASNPGYLNENTSNVPGGTKTYRIWYTTDCNTGVDCECDNVLDTDTTEPPDGTPDEDSPNDCIATQDTNADGIPDTGPDADGDGVLDVMDLDWAGGGDGSGLTESVPRNVQRSVNRFVNDWGLKEPKWNRNTNRNIYVYDIPWLGVAYGNGSGEELDTEWMLVEAPEPRGTVLHELWHNTQYAYDTSSGGWLMDGQARMMQDKVFDDLDNRVGSRYHNSVNAYLANTTWVIREDRDDDDVDEFAQAKGLLGAAYDASLWWTYLADQAGTQYVGTAGEGIDLLEAVLEQADDHGRQGVNAVSRVLMSRLGQGFDDTFWDFTVANYAKGFDLSRLDHDDLGGRDPETVLKYSDEKRTPPDTLIYAPCAQRDALNNCIRWFDGAERTEIGVAALMAGINGHVDAMSSEINNPDAMSAYGANYYEGELDNADCLLAYWRVIGEDGARFMHSWLLVEEDTNADGEEEVISLLRSEGKDFARAIWNENRAATTYTRMVGIVATDSDAYGYDWEMGCAQPSINIVDPVTADPAYVGDPADPGRFLVWLEVTGSGGSSTYVAGLEWNRDFAVTVGGVPAVILNGDYVQDQYWLVVQAPIIPGASIGDEFDLRVELGPGVGISDTEIDAVIYDLNPHDKVLVIDRSGSMGSNNKLESAKIAARYLTEVTQMFDRLGVVSYNEDATNDFSMALIPDQDDAAGVRGTAQGVIDIINDGGYTSVGDGLDKGQDQLDTFGDPDHEWWMVLLSDGLENRSLYWSDVRASIVAAGTKVHAIALGRDADDDLMREIAEATCGPIWQDQCHDFIEESGTLAAAGTDAMTASNLPNALADVYRRAEENIVGHQRLWQDSGVLSGGGNQILNVEINEDGARNAIFSFNWNDKAAPLDVNVSGGDVSFIKLEDGKNHVVFYADNLPPGTYQIEMDAPGGDSEWIGSLSGRLIHGTELHAFIDNRGWLERLPGLPAHLQASLTDDGGPVAGAQIIATAYHPDLGAEQVQLLDDGGPYDDIANDGVYGYVYDRINRPLRIDPALGHTWVFDIHAQGLNNSGKEFERYQRLTYTPALDPEQVSLDIDNDGMLDVWENRFKNVYSVDPGDAGLDLDEDGMTNIEEFERGTNPDDPDTDRGGELDGSEESKGRNPLFTADDAMPPIKEFWVQNEPESVILHFNPQEEYQKMRVYRRTGLFGLFTMIAEVDLPAPNPIAAQLATPETVIREYDPTKGQILDKDLVNDQDYFYYLQPVGESSVVGRPSTVVYAEPAADPYQPEGIVVINDDNKYTSSTNVTLSFQGLTLPDGTRDVTHVQVSNAEDLAGVPWLPFQQEMPWVISPHPDTGQAFVSVRFRDGAGNVSDTIYGDGIIYQPPHYVPADLFEIGRLILDFSHSYFAGWSIGYTPLSAPDLGMGSMMQANSVQANASLLFGGVNFDLAAIDGQGQPVTQFDVPFMLEVHYEDWQWQSGGIGYEDSLNLYWNEGQSWEPVLPCDGCYHDTQNNVIHAVLDHLTEFALLGQPQLPEDVNADGVVDSVDLSDTVGLWRRTVGDPEYDLANDVHMDSIINIIDVQRVADQFGWQLP